MDNQQIQTLISTLMQGGLASSEGEARRMAEDMLGTTAKVQEEYSSKKDQNHMFADRIQAKEAQKTQETPKIQEEFQETAKTVQVEAPKQENQEQSLAMQNKIQELRNAALNPRPVDIQINFQTPKTDREFIDNNKQTIEPEFSQEEANQAAQTNIQNEMPSVDFQIPGIDNNLTINELAQTNQQVPTQQDNFFSQQNTAPAQEQKPQTNEFIQQQPEPTHIQQNSQPSGLESGFPSNNPHPQQQSDFIQFKEEPKQEIPEQTQEVQTSSQNTENSSSTPQRNPTWTEEEKKLRDEVDLTKLFNFGNK